MSRYDIVNGFEIPLALSSGPDVGEKICLQVDMLGRRQENQANRSLVRCLLRQSSDDSKITGKYTRNSKTNAQPDLI